MIKHYYHMILESQPTYCLGDLHGDFNSLVRNIKNNDLSKCNLIILGDIGLGFYSQSIHVNELNNINKILKEREICLYLFRGNHDDPEYFNREIKDGDKFMLSNVKVIPDYTVLTLNNKNALVVGGATSIDRLYRLQEDEQRIKTWLAFYPDFAKEDIPKFIQPSYWKDEAPFFNSEIIDEITKAGIKISVVLSHTCPSCSYPLDKKGIGNWLKRDRKLEFDINHERCVMDNILTYLQDSDNQIEEWVYGHYHLHYQDEVNGIRFTTLFNTDFKFDAYEIFRDENEEE